MANAKNTKKPALLKLDDRTYVKVRSNQYGNMGFHNKRTGDITFWHGINDVQEMTVGDIRAMKSTDPRFLQDTWIVIEDIDDDACVDMSQKEMYEVLGIGQFYETGRPRYLKDILGWSASEIEERAEQMSDNTRSNIITALNTEIREGNLDSIAVTRAWEKALGVKLDTGDD